MKRSEKAKAGPKFRSRSYKDEWYKIGLANGLRLAGVVLGRTHRLENGQLVRESSQRQRKGKG